MGTLAGVNLVNRSGTSTRLTTDMVTGQNTGFSITCETFIPDNNYSVTRFAVRLSTDPTFSTSLWFYGPWQAKGYSCPLHVSPPCQTVSLFGLSSNTKYYVRSYIQYQSSGDIHEDNSGSFYTNRPPTAPTLVTPEDGAFIEGGTITFNVIQNDPDNIGPASSYLYIYYRTTEGGVGAWNFAGAGANTTEVYVPTSTFAPNVQYEWAAITVDGAGAFSPLSEPRAFYVLGGSSGPALISPIGNESIRISDANVFSWRFRDPNQTSVQTQADVRYRAFGTLPWTTVAGSGSNPGGTEERLFPGGTFAPNRYEWQVQTYNSSGATSGWSGSGYFYAVDVGQDSGPVIPEISEIQHALGQGNNEAYVYERGGKRRLGQIKPLASIQWGRKRDDISNALITTNGLGDDDGALLRDLRSWRHEIVIFRDGVRVWEGPVTRVGYFEDHVEIEAKDVMAYVYRRILRQGYNDSYRVLNGVVVGLRSVVVRSRAIIMNALSYDDPNVLRYLTALTNLGDARNSRIVPPYSKTAWGEVDDLAATAGLDYAVIGRRIMLWDTHRKVGQLPEMSDGDFSDSPVVTEYGMSAANVFAVTNNNGVWGIAARVPTPFGASGAQHAISPAVPPEGYLEQLASAYGESAGGATDDVLTAEALAALQATLYEQASRNINGRWPVPVLVRVPDSTTINPEVNLGINQLVPGVWIPLRAVGTLRKVTQIQKLDSMQVTQTAADGEKVTVIMSPAPMDGQDPDSDASAAEA